jgi:outer membrane protein OmpA-like peptidoglycan-associated protein
VFAKVGGWIHEDPDSVKRGFETAVPASVAGLAEHASTPEGAQNLLTTLKRGDYPHIDAAELGRSAGDQLTTENVARSGEGFLSRLFGNKESGVVDGVAASAGVSRSSASKVLGLASQLVLGFVGSEAVRRNMDASGLRGFLAGLRAQAANAMPGALANLFGGPAPIQAPAVTPLPRRSGAGTWILAGLVALGALALMMWRRHGHQEASRVTSTDVQRAQTQMEKPRALFAGTGVTALAQAFEGGGTLPQRFVLRDLGFRADSAEIEPGSAAVLDDVAGVLASHPTARIRVEGHTDDTGSIDLNRKLSQERAEATRTYLMSKGITGDRIESAGFGPDSPVASNSTMAGRTDNRRTEIVVLSR